MKILFVTTKNPEKQGDYYELSLITGLRKILGDDFVEYPKKKILYGDFSESPKHTLHGKGFTYCTNPIKDVSYDRNNIKTEDFDVIIMGSGHMYGEEWETDHHNVWYTDGHDLFGDAKRRITYKGDNIIGCQYTEKCFKRELVENFPSVYQIGFGIPEEYIKPIDLSIKTQLFQSTAPSNACFKENSSYRFDKEEDYYQDMQRSWFGLTSMKGGWDCLRHYEILASGSLLLFKDFNNKPPLIQPNCPTISYSSHEELYSIMNKLVIDNKPTEEYINLLNLQREWLLNHGTCEKRALDIVKILNK